MRIAIVTDSTADIMPRLVDEYNIKVIPLIVNFGGKSYKDRVEISNKEFYEYIADAKTLPTTSQIAPAEFVNVYKACKEEGYDRVLSLHISSEMSGTCQSARVAAELVKDEILVEVVDTRTVTIGQSLIVVSMAKMVKENPDVDWNELLKTLDVMIKNTKILFLLDSLDNLQKGGRIGKASYLVGSVLNIKPILAVEDGFILAHEKVRGKKIEKTLDALTEAVLKLVDADKDICFELGANSEEYLALFESRILPSLNNHQKAQQQRYDNGELGNVVTTHIGLGAVGIAFYQL